MLVHYDSEGSSSPVPESRQLESVENRIKDGGRKDEGDEQEEEDATFDSNDAFGISRLQPDREEKESGHQSKMEEPSARSAPEVLVHDPTSSTNGSNSLITRTSDSVIFYNSSYQDMTRPVEGPANPWNDRTLEKKNTITGYVEQQVFNPLTFKEQQRSFHVLGYASNPSLLSSNPMVGNVHEAFRNNNELVSDLKLSRAQIKAQKRKRKGKGTLGEFEDEFEDEDAEAAGNGEEADENMETVEEIGVDGNVVEVKQKKKKEKVQKEYLGPWAGWEGENIAMVAPTAEEYEEQEANGGAPLNKKQRKAQIDTGKREVGFGEEKSIFHGKDLYDYLGRSYLHIPTDVDVNLNPSEPGLQECFIPKKCIHTWSGHTKGVSKIQLFPVSGHLILSASLDTRIKLWDIYQEGKCLRTFMGHSKAVHDVNFDNDGKQFLSAAFDRQMKLWDTETGKCKQAFSNGKIPYCIKFHPGQQNIFLAGMGDKKIIQYDMRSGEIAQEYDQHLGPVNTINFVDDNRRFITTSDDKTIRVWDYDIPVVIKYIAEPTMHSMPAVGMHPNKKWMAMQSMDNQILIFGADTFKQNRKKRFAGHTVAGYACEPQFSPDGRFVSSGDGQGNMIFWDWKNCRILSRIKAHSQAILSHAWLPHESSKVVTSSWDGLIKLYD